MDKGSNCKQAGKFQPGGIDFEEENLGQTVGTLGRGFSLLLKQSGKEHSVTNWSARVTELLTVGTTNITSSEAKAFLKNLQLLASMNDDIYERFAKNIVLLESKGCRIESISPNNILLTDSSINIVDFFETPQVEKAKGHLNSSLYDMIFPLLDPFMFHEMMRELPEEQKALLICSAKEIVKKCQEAAPKAALTRDKVHFEKFSDDFMYKLFYLDGKLYLNRLMTTINEPDFKVSHSLKNIAG